MTQASSRNPPNNIPSSFRRAQAPCHPDRAKRAEGSAALLYRPWYLLSLLRQGKSPARCALLSLQRLRLPDSPSAKKVLHCCFSVHLFAERGMEKRSCYRKTHSLPFSFLFSLSKRWHHGCSSVVLSAAEGPVSFMSPRAAVERSVGSGRFLGFGPPDLRSE